MNLYYPYLTKMRKRRLQSNCSLVMTRESLNQVEQKVQLSSDCAACSRLASVTGSSLPSPREHGHVRVVCTVVRWSDAGLPGGSVVKNPPANTGGVRDAGSVPVCGRSPGGGNGNPLQYCLGKSMDRGAQRSTVHGVTKSRTGLSG